MNKDEILAKARTENKGVDEVEQSAHKEASKIAMSAGFLISMLFYWWDSIFLKTEWVGPTCLIMYSFLFAIQQWVLAIRLKKALYLILALFFSWVAVGLSVAFFVVPLYLGL